MALGQGARRDLARVIADVGVTLGRASAEIRRGRARSAVSLCWRARGAIGDVIRDLVGSTFRPNATTKRRPETLAEWIAMEADDFLRDLERDEPDAAGQVGRFFGRPKVSTLRLDDEPNELGAAVDAEATPALVIFEWSSDGRSPSAVDVRRLEVRSQAQARWLMDVITQAFPGLREEVS